MSCHDSRTGARVLRFFLGLLLFIATMTHPLSAQSRVTQSRVTPSRVTPSRVTVEQENGKFRLLRDGKPFLVKGVGGDTRLAELKAAGANSIRTWSVDNLGRLLDEAQKHDLMVTAGLWLGHPRHGFNYQNQEAVLKQLEEKIAAVEKYKDHPALLIWGVGNEAEGEGTDPSVWYAINHVAREIKRIDPKHPTMTVIAELGENSSKVLSLEKFCPHIDIVGINSYGGIETVGKRYREAGGTRPYIITEHGPIGPWEVGKTPWGSPFEWTSTEKAEFYAKGYDANVSKQKGLCLGTYAFLWGNKQETTATWFGMLLPDGTRTGAVDAMTSVWTGSLPENQCPRIESLKLKGPARMEPGESVTAVLSANDPESDKLTIKWVLRSDSATIGAGGDPQEAESTIKNALKVNGNEATVTIEEGGGGYRLFAYVFDGQGGAAVANVPLNISAPIKLAKEMPVATLPYVVYADKMKGSAFVPSGYMGNAGSIVMKLDSTENPHSGKTCLEAEYKSGGAWGGVLWQSPPEDWDGVKPGGANLTGATQFKFWVRGDKGGETVNFVFGVLDGNQPYRDTAKGELKDVKLAKEWNKMTIPLRGLDLRQIKTGFGWSLAGQGKPVKFYLDDIRYVSE